MEWSHKFALALVVLHFITSSSPNCKMIRDFKNYSFQIITIRKIKKDEELLICIKELITENASKIY